jgi:hypothetical protein
VVYNPCGGENGPVTVAAFKAADSALRGSNGGFDSHTPPPHLILFNIPFPDNFRVGNDMSAVKILIKLHYIVVADDFHGIFVFARPFLACNVI